MTDYRLGLPDGYVLARRYQVERELGRGGFGITYVAVDQEMGRRVAIKEYFPADHATRDASLTIRSVHDPAVTDGYFAVGRAQFRKECQTLARIDNHNVVPVFHSFDANNTAYILMPFLDGERLRDWRLRIGAPRQEEIRRIAQGVLDGLAAVHATGLLHRDVSPDNILLDPVTLHPTIIDFGASRQAASIYTRSFVRTVKDGYSPPELYVTLHSSRNDEGPWCDIYSLGATLYFLITGRPPEPAPLRQTSTDTDLAQLPEADGYSHEFIAAVDRALSLRGQDRFASIDDFRAALFAGQPSTPKPAPPPPTDVSDKEQNAEKEEKRDKYLTFTELQATNPQRPKPAKPWRSVPWLGAAAAAVLVLVGSATFLGNSWRSAVTEKRDAAAQLAAAKARVDEAEAASKTAEKKARESDAAAAKARQDAADDRAARDRADQRTRESQQRLDEERRLKAEQAREAQKRPSNPPGPTDDVATTRDGVGRLARESPSWCRTQESLNSTEKLICTETQLSGLDNRFNAVSKSALAAAPDASQKKTLQQFLDNATANDRDKKCGESRTCIVAFYEGAIGTLQRKAEERHSGSKRESASVPAIAGKQTRSYDNFDLSGKDLGEPIKDISFDQCAQRCDLDARCVALSFDKWNNWCFHKSESGRLRLEAKSISRVRGAGQEPQRSTSSTKIQRYRGREFPSEGEDRSVVADAEACEGACESASSCIAYTFLKSTKQCRLMRSTRGKYVTNADADSGAKRQDVE